MTHYDQFVLNSPTWSDSGYPVDDTPVIDVENPGGFVVNVRCGCDGSKPLVPLTVVRRSVNRPIADDHPDCLPLPVLNFAEGDHSFDRTIAGNPPVARGGVHSQDAQYGPAPRISRREDDEEYADMQREQRRRLGLNDPDAPLVPGVMASIVHNRRRERRLAAHA